MIRPGRSKLLLLNDPSPGRDRPFWRRRAVVAGGLALVSLPAAVALTEALPPTGIGYLIYQLHDSLWLPLWSVITIRAGIWSLLWWLPFLCILALVAVEFLGLGQPWRRLQIFVLRRLLRSRLSPHLLALQQRLGWSRNHEGLLVAVLISEIERQVLRLCEAMEAGEPARTDLATRLMYQLAYLRAADPREQVRCAELLALIRLCQPQDDIAAHIARLSAIWPAGDGARLALLTTAPDAITPPPIQQLRSPLSTASDLAFVTLALCTPDATDRPDLVRDWLVDWARLSHDPASPQPALRQAEGMIEFEFWAARAEAAIARAGAPDSRASWLSALVPGLQLRRPLGELAAAGQKEQV